MKRTNINLKILSKKFHRLTNGKYRISIKWITKKAKRLFPLKDKDICPACKLYHGLCSCKEKYIGESKRNTTTPCKHTTCVTRCNNVETLVST